MIQIKTDYIEGIPVLNIAKDSLENEALPTLTFLHGFTSSKEQNLSYAYLLAEKGIRVLLPDLPHHGERGLHVKPDERQWQFWDIIVQGISELGIIINHYITDGKVDPNRIGVAGTSMGSITMFGALTQYEWIKISVSMMGTPSYVQFANLMLKSFPKNGVKLPLSTSDLESKVNGLKKFDLSLQPELLRNRPLLLWHGESDSVVPYELTRTFYEGLINRGHVDENQVQLVTDPMAGHKVSRDACHMAVSWIVEKL